MTTDKKQPISNEDLLEAIGKGFQSMEDRMITKEDLKNFATKDDLKEAIENAVQPLATKLDLTEYAKNSDLENLATKADIARLEAKIDGIKIMEIQPLKERVLNLEKHSKFAHA